MVAIQYTLAVRYIARITSLKAGWVAHGDADLGQSEDEADEDGELHSAAR